VGIEELNLLHMELIADVDSKGLGVDVEVLVLLRSEEVGCVVVVVRSVLDVPRVLLRDEQLGCVVIVAWSMLVLVWVLLRYEELGCLVVVA
jgi:hypothetical protein